MLTSTYEAATIAILVLLAGLMMANAALGKKMLGWKPSHQRCRACGQPRRLDCPCRR